MNLRAAVDLLGAVGRRLRARERWTHSALGRATSGAPVGRCRRELAAAASWCLDGAIILEGPETATRDEARALLCKAILERDPTFGGISRVQLRALSPNRAQALVQVWNDSIFRRHTHVTAIVRRARAIGSARLRRRKGQRC